MKASSKTNVKGSHQLPQIPEGWRRMPPLRHLRYAKNVWIFGDIGTGKDALLLKLNERVKHWKHQPEINVVPFGVIRLSPLLEDNDVIIRARHRPMNAIVYRVTVTKDKSRYFYRVGQIQYWVTE